MPDEWDERIRNFWRDASDVDEQSAFGAMRSLIDERPEDDPAATYEWASVHDFLGHEAEAIPLYRHALSLGLDATRRSQAQIQLASSLRNVGNATEAIRILEDMESCESTGDAQEAFLALALFDAGRPGEALRIALMALGKTLPLHSGAITHYAEEIVSPKSG